MPIKASKITPVDDISTNGNNGIKFLERKMTDRDAKNKSSKIYQLAYGDNEAFLSKLDITSPNDQSVSYLNTLEPIIWIIQRII